MRFDLKSSMVETKRVKVAVYSIALNEEKHAKRWAHTTRYVPEWICT